MHFLSCHDSLVGHICYAIIVQLSILTLTNEFLNFPANRIMPVEMYTFIGSSFIKKLSVHNPFETT